MPLAIRTSGVFWSRRSSASTATRNSAAVTVLDGRKLRRTAGGQLQFAALAAPRHAVGKGGQHGDQQRVLVAAALSGAADRPMRRICRTICAVRGSHCDSISTSRSERVA